MNKQSNRTFRLTALTLLPSILLGITLPIQPAKANQFNVCVEQMVKSGVSGDAASTACADALIPQELSKCVQRIRQNMSDLQADAVLQNCYRVRRPVDLANCVVDINKAGVIQAGKTTQTPKPEESPEATSTPPTPSNDSMESLKLMVLESCRSSLLPGRYSECVTAVAQNLPQEGIATALNTCLSAEDFPVVIFPNVPQN